MSYEQERDLAPLISSLERTAKWVDAQAGQTYEDLPRSSPSSSTHLPPSPTSNRTTTSSDQSTTQSSVPAAKPLPITPNSSIQRAPSALSRPVGASFPFPQSPPGSGYPLQLEIVPPRADAAKASRASTKKRRPSLIDHFRGLAQSSTKK